MAFPTIEEFIGNTPLVRMQRMVDIGSNTILMKLEGNNPAGSVKDRPALSMISAAEYRGEISPGDALVEATSGNTGIALAMAAAIKGYKMTLIMPANASKERVSTMKAYGAEVILVTKEQGMEGARDLALNIQSEGKAKILNQFANPDNPLAHYKTTGPEIWRDTQGKITHFVSSMGTTGTITGVSKFLKEQNKDIQIIGAEPAEGASIPGIRKWPPEYVPAIFNDEHIDQVIQVTQAEAELTMRNMASKEGVFAGVSSGGAMSIALRIAQQVSDAVIVTIVCDRGDRYLSTGVYPEYTSIEELTL